MLRTKYAWALILLSSISAVWADEPKQPDTVIPVARPDVGWQKRHEQINQRAKQGNVDLLFVGDSITQGWIQMSGVWEKHYANRKAMNAGIGGDRTQHVLYRLEHGNLENIKPKLMVLMIGTNNASSNSAEDIAAGIKAIVKKYRELRPESKVLLLAIFPRGDKPNPQRDKLAEASRMASEVADGKQVHYLDIGPKFLEADGTIRSDIMYDYLHLTDKGYTRWGEAIEAKVKELLCE